MKNNPNTKKNLLDNIERIDLHWSVKISAYAKYLNGRNYIHQNATKQQIQNIYEELVNHESDNRVR